MPRKFILCLSLMILGSLIGFLLAALRGSSIFGDFVPARPSSLPPTAVYAGGVDGGEWVSCKFTEDNRISCFIYDSETGRQRYERSMKVCPAVQLKINHGIEKVSPEFLDAEIGIFTGLAAYDDRPMKYFPLASDTPEEVAHEAELARKYYEGFGVKSDCSLVSRP